MKQTFVVDGRYRNRHGEYLVLAIDGNTMVIRYDDGTESAMKTDVQARIWGNIQAETEPAPPKQVKRRPLPPKRRGVR